MIPALPPTPPAVVQFVAAVANIRHDEPKPWRISDINALADMLPDGYPWIAGGAEIDNRVSRVAWTQLLGGIHFGLATESPVAASGDWTELGHAVHVDTAGIPSVDPARKTVVLKLRNDATGIKVAVVNTHMDHLAFGAKKNLASRHGWFAQWHSDRALIARLRLLGYVVVQTCDCNHAAGPVKWGRGQISVFSGLMQISVLPPFGRSVSVALGHIDRAWAAQGIHTDHPLLTVPVTIAEG